MKWWSRDSQLIASAWINAVVHCVLQLCRKSWSRLHWRAPCHIIQSAWIMQGLQDYTWGILHQTWFWFHCFYRTMLCIRGTSHGPLSVCVSVCLSVTSLSSTKTAKRRITQTTPHDSPGTLVFWCQRSPRNSTGVTPYGGAECRWGGSKSATFHK